MKPCAKNRKLIAWLALDALDAQEAAVLRAHLVNCEGCRSYWEEISNVTAGLRSAAPDSDIEASEAFHRRVAERMQTVESGSILENVAAWLRTLMPGWRVALPITAVLVLALLASLVPRHPPVSPSPGNQVVSAFSSGSGLAPTLANYQMVANQSLEKLSELLTEQGSVSLPPAPIYTASSLGPAND